MFRPSSLSQNARDVIEVESKGGNAGQAESKDIQYHARLDTLEGRRCIPYLLSVGLDLSSARDAVLCLVHTP
jgi:hypothetical protein